MRERSDERFLCKVFGERAVTHEANNEREDGPLKPTHQLACPRLASVANEEHHSLIGQRCEVGGHQRRTENGPAGLS
jgi:hypothetical protein